VRGNHNANFNSLESERDNKKRVLLLRENNAMYTTCDSRNAMIYVIFIDRIKRLDNHRLFNDTIIFNEYKKQSVFS